MDTGDIKRFSEEITKAALEAGKYARDSQGTVENNEKDHPLTTDADPEFVQRRDRAKTVIDEHVQEMLLSTVQSMAISVRIDAEEDTPLRETLHTESAPMTVVIDPVDGTLEYFEGGSDWYVNVALVSGGKVLFALMYSPVPEILYLLDVDGKSYTCTCQNGAIVRREPMLSPSNTESKKLYFNNRVPEDAIEKLSHTFEVVRDIHGIVKWPDALLGCISREYKAALFVRPQIRDVLIGAMIETLPGGYAVDFSGKKITWPDGGRIPEVAFGFGELPEEIKAAFG